jgi:hypothetical protein
MMTSRVISDLPALLIRAAGNMLARRRGAERLFVLNYHRILAQPDPLFDDEPTVDTFRWQMQLLARCFNVLPLPEAMTRLAAGACRRAPSASPSTTATARRTTWRCRC